MSLSESILLDLVNWLLLPGCLHIIFQQFLNCHFGFADLCHGVTHIETRSLWLTHLIVNHIRQVKVNDLPLGRIRRLNLVPHYIGVSLSHNDSLIPSHLPLLSPLRPTHLHTVLHLNFLKLLQHLMHLVLLMRSRVSSIIQIYGLRLLTVWNLNQSITFTHLPNFHALFTGIFRIQVNHLLSTFITLISSGSVHIHVLLVFWFVDLDNLLAHYGQLFNLHINLVDVGILKRKNVRKLKVWLNESCTSGILIVLRDLEIKQSNNYYSTSQLLRYGINSQKNHCRVLTSSRLSLSGACNCWGSS